MLDKELLDIAVPRGFRCRVCGMHWPEITGACCHRPATNTGAPDRADGVSARCMSCGSRTIVMSYALACLLCNEDSLRKEFSLVCLVSGMGPVEARMAASEGNTWPLWRMYRCLVEGCVPPRQAASLLDVRGCPWVLRPPKKRDLAKEVLSGMESDRGRRDDVFGEGIRHSKTGT